MLKRIFKPAALAGAIVALSVANLAHAEQTIGVQAPGSVAKATARVNVVMTVQNIVFLRVGSASATVDTVGFTLGTASNTPLTVGDNQAYAPTTTPPTGISLVNATGSTGSVTTAAWTNAKNGAKLTCTLGAVTTTGTYTPFASGATAGGVPGTASIAAAGTGPAHPGTTLADCDGTKTASIGQLTAVSGAFTYTPSFDPTTVNSGSYGNSVIYLATTL